jgi:hypothetical protein
MSGFCEHGDETSCSMTITGSTIGIPLHAASYPPVHKKHDSLRAGRSGDRILVGARFSAPSLLYNGYRVFPGGKAAGACR